MWDRRRVWHYVNANKTQSRAYTNTSPYLALLNSLHSNGLAMESFTYNIWMNDGLINSRKGKKHTHTILFQYTAKIRQPKQKQRRRDKGVRDATLKKMRKFLNMVSAVYGVQHMRNDSLATNECFVRNKFHNVALWLWWCDAMQVPNTYIASNLERFIWFRFFVTLRRHNASLAKMSERARVCLWVRVCVSVCADDDEKNFWQIENLLINFKIIMRDFQFIFILHPPLHVRNVRNCIWSFKWVCVLLLLLWHHSTVRPIIIKYSGDDGGSTIRKRVYGDALKSKWVCDRYRIACMSLSKCASPSLLVFFTLVPPTHTRVCDCRLSAIFATEKSLL